MTTDKELLDMARAAVPEHLRTAGHVVRHDRPKGIMPAGIDPNAELTAAIAAELEVDLPEPTEVSADVEFRDDSELGTRSTVVQIRNGQVAKVLKRA